MSSQVQMIRSRANFRYITKNGSTVASTSATSADNFIFHFIGSNLFLRPYNNSAGQLLRVSQNQCTQQLQTSSTGSPIHRVSAVDGSTGGTTRVRLFIRDDSTGERWYLRVNSFFHHVSLECQSSLDNATPFRKREFEFDIIPIPTAGL